MHVSSSSYASTQMHPELLPSNFMEHTYLHAVVCQHLLCFCSLVYFLCLDGVCVCVCVSVCLCVWICVCVCISFIRVRPSRASAIPAPQVLHHQGNQLVASCFEFSGVELLHVRICMCMHAHMNVCLCVHTYVRTCIFFVCVDFRTNAIQTNAR